MDRVMDGWMKRVEEITRYKDVEIKGRQRWISKKIRKRRSNSENDLDVLENARRREIATTNERTENSTRDG